MQAVFEDAGAGPPPPRPSRAPLAALAANLGRAPDDGFRLGVFAVYLVLLLLGHAWHAMWRDEIQAWLIVRDSASLADLFRNLRYEGHPALWYLLLRPFSWLGREPDWMHPAQVLAAASTVWLLLWKGPFSRIEAALLPFGYVFLFEYGIKSRSYGLGAALTLLFCTCFDQRRRRPEILAVILALMANVAVFYAILASAAAAALLLERILDAWSEKAAKREAESRHARFGTAAPVFTGRDAAALLIVLAGLAAAVVTAWPAPDSGYAAAWQFDAQVAHVRATSRALKALVYDTDAAWLATAAGLVVVLVVLARWPRAPVAATFFLACVAGVAAFIHVKHGPYPWHRGVLAVALVATVWLSRLETPNLWRKTTGAALLPGPLFALILVAQAANGLQSAATDALRPSSNGKAIAAFITRQGWAGMPLYTLDDLAGSTVVGYLGVDSAHYAQGARSGSFIVWDTARWAAVDADAFLRSARDAGNATLLACALGAPGDPTAFGFMEVARFEGSSMQEDCVVYRPAPAP